ncbi:helix-turn-helix transcriptional regulator [Paenibacillus agricola]|uniref:AraC family transcriptional regulator n=1 Tax=Paenibacillus agricola TaxID=2716264 RepID=A0ABX0J9H2_9BACL|nr:AraC family transcriptional regulator [Paenibacillus agricola]NHN33097.1 AraC family transcriptional regulator [Paenibacillus agricola]
MLSSYGFRYSKQDSSWLVIQTIGYQTVTGEGYTYDGMNRDTHGHLFQYTLSGKGYIEVNGRLFAVPKHSAFMVTIPGTHRYYYDPASEEPWELIWLRFSGDISDSLWAQIGGHGPVLPFEAASAPIQLLWKMYRDVLGQKLNDVQEQSVRIYEWLVAVWSQSVKDELAVAPGESKAQSYEQAIRFMRSQLHRPLTLEELADSEGLSKYHFCKYFHKKKGLSPMAYLSRLRVEEAARLLTATELPISEIARLTSFDNAGYFTKVFKRTVGYTPTDYREGKHEPVVSFLKIL